MLDFVNQALGLRSADGLVQDIALCTESLVGVALLSCFGEVYLF